jgi:hypothetical protein
MNKLGLSQQQLKNRRIIQMKERPGQPTKPNQIWEMDMTKTYLTGYGWLYIMAIIDRYDRPSLAMKSTPDPEPPSG